jgi:hypothetical protein
MSDTALVSILGIIGTLGGALMSQWISARSALRVKKIELVYARKVDAYKLLFEKAGEFAADSKNHLKYLIFQSALHAAMIVASEEVSEALDDPRKKGLQYSATLLRTADNENEIQRIQMREWYSSMEAVKNTMRADVGALIGRSQ